MSIIQQIREKYAAVGFGFIALSLIAFILMDAGKSGSGGRGGVSESDAIGDINGVNISYGQYLEKTAMMEKNYAAQGRQVDDNTKQQINSDTWRGMVEQEIMGQELEKLGLRVTNKEFADMLFGTNPPEDFKKAFSDPKTGIFDAAKARQWVAQQKKSKGKEKGQIEEFFTTLIFGKRQEKYNALLQSSAFVPTWMAEKSMADNSAIVGFNYVAVPYTTIIDSTVKISDDQINTYVQAHKNMFKQEGASKSIEYVSFGFAPTTADTSAALQSLLTLKEEFKNTKDPAAFVARNASSLPFYDGFMSQEKIQIAQKDSIVGAGLNNVFGPYLDNGSLVMSRVVEMKMIPDSVKCRHLLVKIADQNGQIRDDSAAHKKIDSLKALVDGGADFNSLVQTASDDDGSKPTKGEYTFQSSNFGSISKEFAETIFYGNSGDKKIVRVQNQGYVGYHYIEVLQQYSLVVSYKIAYMGKAIDPSQETINDAQGRANAFYSTSSNLKDFEATVAKDKLSKETVADVSENDYQIQNLGVNRKLVRNVFDKNVGDVLEPEELDNKFVVIAVTASTNTGLASAAKARPQIENVLRNEEKAKIIIGKMGKITTLEEAAQKQGIMVLRADSVSFAAPSIPNGGYEPKVVGYASGKASLNKVSPAFGGTSGVFVIKPDMVGAKAENAGTVEETQKMLMNQLKQSATYSSMQALKNASKIEDRRSKFL